MKNIKFLGTVMAGIMAVSILAGCGGGNNDKNDDIDDTRTLTVADQSYLNLAGTDALGRKIETAAGYKKGDRHVGIFYSFWEGQHQSLQSSINDIQKLLDQGEEGQAKLNDLSDAGQFYFWGEPLYGYYNMQDPWVLTRHMELLTMAGVDFLCVDATNEHDYVEVGRTLLPIIRSMRNQGFNAPGVCFYTNTRSGDTVTKIYNDYYKDGEWDDLWYKPNGRPLIVGITENNNMASDQTRFYAFSNFVSAAMQRYFEVKESEWPNGIHNDNSMPWMSWDWPQRIHNGYISVPVAQHGHKTISVSHKSPESHRGYDNSKGIVTGDYREGLSFQQMWNTVFEHEDEISTVLVCSWNEWMAQKQPNTGDFVDVYNWEYSRDIEMMKGGYGDNYYLQLCENIRRFKLGKGSKQEYPAAQINIDAADLSAEFANVKSHYQDFAGDAVARNFRNAAGTETYVDNSNRNDITDVKVAHDSQNMYFYVKTKEDITAYDGGDNWMNILIGNGSANDTFAGYKYAINRTPDGNKTSVDVYSGGKWSKAGEAELRVSGNVMVVSVPLSLIGKSANDVSIEFKVADNVQKPLDIMDYYVSGDSAPIGRLSWAYGK